MLDLGVQTRTEICFVWQVDSLKIKLLEKLKCLLPELQIELREAEATVSISDEASKTGPHTDSLSSLPSEGSRNQVNLYTPAYIFLVILKLLIYAQLFN